ncbi:MAG: hypothetical protein JWM57_93 [Phycisphaerales bacterium]|nr:hypothetical protein [Phycisphaerales bacterium]
MILMPFAMTQLAPLLAQAGSDSGVFDVLYAVVLILIGVALLIGGVAVIRKRFSAAEETDAAAGFSLSSMRQLVKAGKMSQEEYDRAKEQIVAAMHKAEARKVAEKAVAAERALQKTKGIPPGSATGTDSGYVPPAPPV